MLGSGRRPEGEDVSTRLLEIYEVASKERVIEKKEKKLTRSAFRLWVLEGGTKRGRDRHDLLRGLEAILSSPSLCDSPTTMSSSFNRSDDIDPFAQDSPSSPSPFESPKLAQQTPLPPDNDEEEDERPPSFNSSTATPPPPPPPREPTPPPPTQVQPPQTPSRAYNRNSGFEHAATSVGRYLQQSDWVIEVKLAPSPKLADW